MKIDNNDIGDFDHRLGIELSILFEDSVKLYMAEHEEIGPELDAADHIRSATMKATWGLIEDEGLRGLAHVIYAMNYCKGDIASVREILNLLPGGKE